MRSGVLCVFTANACGSKRLWSATTGRMLSGIYDCGSCNALANLTTGAGNTGIGWYSLFFAGSSSFSTGVGAGALVLNGGDSNTAVGAAALLLNSTGTENTAVGVDATTVLDAWKDAHTRRRMHDRRWKGCTSGS